MPVDAPSPSPSTLPPTNKRSRPSAGGAGAGGAAGGGAGGSRSKRAKKVEESAAANSDTEGPVKKKGGKDDDEDGELHTKIDFRDLPDETLYRYLEMHNLLPTLGPSPWLESDAIPPNELYSTNRPVSPSKSQPQTASQTQTQTQARQPSPVKPSASTPSVARRSEPPSGNVNAPEAPTTDAAAAKADGTSTPVEAAAEDANANANAEDDAAPTTRSKTAPLRKEPTPPPTVPEGSNRSEHVFTLSDVPAARDILAEKANQHWMKGLGGGQNKESETIVQFLYKLKVGPGRLLRVYNPNPSMYTYRS